MIKKFKTWTISVVTVALLATSGYFIGDWDKEKGYPVIGPLGDTTFVKDSLRLTEIADSLHKAFSDSFAIAVFKIGDQRSEKGFKDGQLVSVFDFKEQEPGFIFSKKNQKVYYCKKIPKDQVNFYRSKLMYVDDSVRVAPKAIFRYSKLSEEEKAKVDSAELAKPVTLLVDSMVDFDEESEELNPSKLDVNSITSGTADVGSAGDYATWALCAADIDSLTDALTVAQISHTTETGASNFTMAINHKIRLITDSTHSGNLNNGWISSTAFATHLFIFATSESDTFEIDGLYFKYTGGVTSANGLFRNNMSDSPVLLIRNVAMDGGNQANTQMFSFTTTTSKPELHNIIGTRMAKGGKFFTTTIFENCSFCSCSVAGLDFASATQSNTIRNCLFINASGLGLGYSDGYNNASNDTTYQDANWNTGSNNIDEITPTNEVISLDFTYPYFLVLKSGAIDSAGTATSIADNTAGVRGNPRPGRDGNYSIGANEYEVYYKPSKPASAILDTNSGTANSADTSGLVHVWNFNSDTITVDSTADSIGTNHGEMSGGAIIQEVSKYGDGALYLDGDNAKCVINPSGENFTDLDTVSEVTISCWFNQFAIDHSDYLFYGTVTIGSVQNILINIGLGGNILVGYAYDGTNRQGVWDYSKWYSEGEWAHLCWVFDGAGADNTAKCKLYFNGEQITFDSFNGTFEATTPRLNGAEIGFGKDTFAFKGKVDDFKIWNRALSAKEAFTEYANTCSNFKVADTCNGSAESDTSFHDQEVDTVFFWTESGSDTLEFLLSDGLTHDISSLFSGVSTYDTVGLRIDSVFTVDKRDTIYAKNSNIIGASGLVWHYPWIYFENTTAIDSLPAVTYDTTYRDTTKDSIRIDCDSAQEIYKDSLQIDSIGGGDTTVNWKVEIRDSILMDTVFVDYGPSYDTSYTDTAVQCSVCLENNKLVEFSGDSMHIDSVCFEDTSADWSVTWRDSIHTDTTDNPTFEEDGLQDSAPVVQWVIDTVVANPDTSTDTITTVSGDTTFFWSREVVVSCSTIYDSTRTILRRDSVTYTINYCSGDTSSVDSYGIYFEILDTIVDVTEDLCGIVAYDTSESPYDFVTYLFDTTYSDTNISHNVYLDPKRRHRAYGDSMHIDSIRPGIDTTVDYKIIFRDSLYWDTINAPWSDRARYHR